MAQAHIIADNLLLCIAFSKDGSTVYLMFQQKNGLKAGDLPFYCSSFLGTIFKTKQNKQKKKTLMMGVRLCDYTANAYISMLQLILCDIVCFHSKCK